MIIWITPGEQWLFGLLFGHWLRYKKSPVVLSKSSK